MGLKSTANVYEVLRKLNEKKLFSAELGSFPLARGILEHKIKKNTDENPRHPRHPRHPHHSHQLSTQADQPPKDLNMAHEFRSEPSSSSGSQVSFSGEFLRNSGLNPRLPQLFR